MGYVDLFFTIHTLPGLAGRALKHFAVVCTLYSIHFLSNYRSYQSSHLMKT